jgi:hypothetical protein
MSSVAIVRALLKQRTGLLAVVPEGRIYAGIAPQDAVYPTIGVSEVSNFPKLRTTRRAGATEMVEARVQVTVYAKTYQQMKDLLLLCKIGPGTSSGIVMPAPNKFYTVNAVLPWGVNPEIPPGDDKIYEQSRDFMVTFAEAN